jgi:hypothetical protein
MSTQRCWPSSIAPDAVVAWRTAGTVEWRSGAREDRAREDGGLEDGGTGHGGRECAATGRVEWRRHRRVRAGDRVCGAAGA